MLNIFVTINNIAIILFDLKNIIYLILYKNLDGIGSNKWAKAENISSIGWILKVI